MKKYRLAILIIVSGFVVFNFFAIYSTISGIPFFIVHGKAKTLSSLPKYWKFIVDIGRDFNFEYRYDLILENCVAEAVTTKCCFDELVSRQNKIILSIDHCKTNDIARLEKTLRCYDRKSNLRISRLIGENIHKKPECNILTQLSYRWIKLADDGRLFADFYFLKSGKDSDNEEGLLIIHAY